MKNWKPLSKKWLLLVMVGLFALCSANAFGGTIYIPDDHPTIQEGIDAAVAGDTVIVRDGTYLLTAALDFKGKAITLRSEHGLNSCILDGQQLTRVVYFHTNEGAGSVLSGFTIRNGKADKGGGISCEGSSPTISDCAIISNSSYGDGINYHSIYGGGIYCHGSSPVISNCTITSNTAYVWSGYSSAYSYGGGVYCESGSPTIRDSVVSGNTATSPGGSAGHSYGGGMYFLFSTPSIANCTITNNATSGNSESNGGGIYLTVSGPSIVNTIINGNSAKLGAGIYFDQSSSFTTLTNCTLVRNTATTGGAFYCQNSSPIVINSILWQDSPDEIFNAGTSAPIVTYSDVTGGHAGAGNIDANPRFVDIANQDFHLSANPILSPCIDTGDNSASELPPTDRDGNPRIRRGTVDMGAYEYQPNAATMLYGDFGSAGLWKYDGSWAQAAPANPGQMAVNGQNLLVMFPGIGLYQYDGTVWTLLTSYNGVENFIAIGGVIYVDCGALGLWKYDGAWASIASADSDRLAANGNKLLANFPGYGLYEYDGAGWKKLTASNPENLIAVDQP